MKKVIENIPAEQICKRLRTVRIQLKFKSIKAFADKLGVNYTTYRNYEINRIPPAEILYKLKETFPHGVNAVLKMPLLSVN